MIKRTAFFIALVSIVGFMACGDRVDLERSLSEITQLHVSSSYAETVERLAELRQEYPNDPRVNRLYGLALVQTDNIGMAIWPLRRAAELRGWTPVDGLAYVEALMRSTDPDGAAILLALDRVLAKAPEHRRARLLRAATSDRLGRAEDVLEEANTLLSRSDEDPQALMWKIRALVGLDRFEEAEAVYDAASGLGLSKAQSRVPGQICALGAWLAEEREDMVLAASRWESCLDAIDPDGAAFRDAIAFFDENQLDERADEAYALAIDRAPGELSLRRRFAHRLRAQQRLSESEEVLRAAVDEGLPGSWFALAEHFRAVDSTSSAREAMAAGMAKVRTPNEMLRAQYADDLIADGHLDEASQLIQSIEDPRFVHLLRGRRLLAIGRPEEALEELGVGLELWPGNVTARWLSARAAEQLGDFDRSIAEYRAAIRADPAATDAALRAAQILDASGAQSDALLLLGHRIRAVPEDPEALRWTARIAYRAGRGPVASDALEALSRIPGMESEAIAEAAALQWNSSGPAAALVTIDRKSEDLDLLDPQHAPVLRAWMDALIALGRLDEAVDQARRAVERNPEDPDTLEIAARVSLAKAAPEEARRRLEAATGRAPGHPMASIALARLRAAAGRTDLALALLNEVIAASERDEHGAGWAAIEILDETGDDERLATWLEALLSKEPIHAGAAARLATLLLDSGEDLDRAAALADRSLRFGGGTDALVARGRIALARGDLSLASRLLSVAAERRPGDDTIRVALEQARRPGDESEAREFRERGLPEDADE